MGTKTEPSPVHEGKAKAFLPKTVFYNPVQEFNRDLTIAVISEYGKLLFEAKIEKLEKRNARLKDDELRIPTLSEWTSKIPGEKCDNGLSIFEGLAASGLRSCRFAKEIPGLNQVYANDFDEGAVEIMQQNIELNDIGHLMSASCNDAALALYLASRRKFPGFDDYGFDVIDLDPYGSPTQFLDGAVQAVKDGGLLCVTCTDMAILCGNAHEKCFASYGATSFKTAACHELALRIVLRTLDSFANRYGRYIVPLISLSVDFYCRVFVIVRHGPALVKEAVTKSGMVYECTGCETQYIQPLGVLKLVENKTGELVKKFTYSQGPPTDRKCQFCNSTHHIGGPLWISRLHDPIFVSRVLERVKSSPHDLGTSSRIIGMLTLVSEELHDVPLYYRLDQLCKVVKAKTPRQEVFWSALMNAGYKVSLSHANKLSLKTAAPPHVIWDIFRCWMKENPVKSEYLEDTNSIPYRILNKEPELQANFEIREDVVPKSKKDGLLRFQTGMKNWGPKMKAGTNEQKQNEKRKLNQNRRVEKRQKTADGIDYKQYHCAALKKTGECSFGDECKYSHDFMTEDDTALLDEQGETNPETVSFDEQGETNPVTVSLDNKVEINNETEQEISTTKS